jgi:hypothetical protein
MEPISKYFRFADSQDQTVDIALKGFGFINAVPEQIVAFLQILERIKPAKIQPMYYDGALNVSPFAGYVAKTNFFALSLCMNCAPVALQGGAPGKVAIYDENNVETNEYTNAVAFYDIAAAADLFMMNSIELKNVFFSTVNGVQYSHVKFIGFQLLSV